MRISVWSSDVCSSDLERAAGSWDAPFLAVAEVRRAGSRVEFVDRVCRIGGGQGFHLLPVDAFFVEDLDRSGDDGRAFQRVHLVWKPGALGKEDVALCRFLPGHDRVRPERVDPGRLAALVSAAGDPDPDPVEDRTSAV